MSAHVQREAAVPAIKMLCAYSLVLYATYILAEMEGIGRKKHERIESDRVLWRIVEF